MPTFTETREIVSIELIPGKNHINCKYKNTTFKDGVAIASTEDGKSYIGDTRFSIEIAPTGASLASIVAGLNTAALQERDDSNAAKISAKAAADAAEKENARLAQALAVAEAAAKAAADKQAFDDAVAAAKAA